MTVGSPPGADRDIVNQAAGFYWEDVIVGERARSSAQIVTEEEILAFATTYDPLPIHIDAQAAARGPYGKLTAAGTHMLAIRQKLLYDFVYPEGVVASIGYDEVRFLAPLHAGQQCHVEIEFLEKRASTKRADRGIVIIAMTLFADDTAVLSLRDIVLMRRRPAFAA